MRRVKKKGKDYGKYKKGNVKCSICWRVISEYDPVVLTCPECCRRVSGRKEYKLFHERCVAGKYHSLVNKLDFKPARIHGPEGKEGVCRKWALEDDYIKQKYKNDSTSDDISMEGESKNQEKVKALTRMEKLNAYQCGRYRRPKE